jgi:hypothetical protein
MTQVMMRSMTELVKITHVYLLKLESSAVQYAQEHPKANNRLEFMEI